MATSNCLSAIGGYSPGLPLRRVYAKRLGEDLSEPVLYAETADIDGPLSEELVVRYVEAIARSAQAGFVDVDGFPIFGSMECPRKGGDNA